MTWDFFISHATEDKADVARPLYEMLMAKGFRVWYDEYTLTLGDNLRRSIEQGLANSRYGIVILSPSFFAKKWTQLELDGLFALERPSEKRILPVWHNVTASDVERFSSFMAMRLGVPTSSGLENVVRKIIEAVTRSPETTAAAVVGASHELHPHSIEILKAAQAGDGRIVTIRHMQGFAVRAGGKSMGDEANPRAEALNLHCLDELIGQGLIEQLSGSLLALTQEGYDYVIPSGIVEAPEPQMPSLTQPNYRHAKEIMQAAVAANGTVVTAGYIGGYVVQAGKWSQDSKGDRRVEARLKAVLLTFTP